jgi:MFS family permease
LLIAAFAAGFGGAVWNVIASTLRQNLAEEGQIGRVTGAFRLVAYASMPAAALLAGWLAQRLGARPVLLGSAVLVAVLSGLALSGIPAGHLRLDEEPTR